MGIIKLFLDSRWIRFFSVVVRQVVEVATNPSYITFSFIALSLGTMGVWIEVFPSGLVDDEKLVNAVEGISTFTFCIATLGSVATEAYFRNNYVDKPDEIMKKHLGILGWMLCLFFTFYSYVVTDGSLLGFWMTVGYWVLINIERQEFRKPQLNVLDAEPGEDDGVDAFEGVGL